MGDAHPTWSDDGTKIAFDRVEKPGGDGSIYVVSASGGPLKRLGPGWDPDWSPAGDKVIFTDDGPPDAYDQLTVDVYVMAPDGTGRRKLTRAPDEDGGSPAWSPDGREIVFISNRGGFGEEIWTMKPDGDDPRLVGQRVEGDPDYVGYAAEPDWQPVPETG